MGHVDLPLGVENLDELLINVIIYGNLYLDLPIYLIINSYIILFNLTDF